MQDVSSGFAPSLAIHYFSAWRVEREVGPAIENGIARSSDFHKQMSGLSTLAVDRPSCGGQGRFIVMAALDAAIHASHVTAKVGVEMPGLSAGLMPRPLEKRACRRVIQKAAPVARAGTFFETRLRRSSERGPRQGSGVTGSPALSVSANRPRPGADSGQVEKYEAEQHRRLAVVLGREEALREVHQEIADRHEA